MFSDPLSFWKDVAIIIAGVVALITFFFGVLEFVRQGHQHRARQFVEMRRRFLETPQYREILDLLAANDPRLAEVSIQEKRNFLGFLEEVALMVKSRLIRREVAAYMFGHYVLLASRSEIMWANLHRESPYWRIFWNYADSLERSESRTEDLGRIRF
jgi:hypothetical protein